PKSLESAGFKFRYTNLQQALENAVK
ncbi:MAG: DUF1731 domain-containing protein, partial [Acidobacteria bacterium]|nr:DUF1731 domain-containing protein [Acidobacteriota bacterium]